jgi:hypothetical protein
MQFTCVHHPSDHATTVERNVRTFVQTVPLVSRSILTRAESDDADASTRAVTVNTARIRRPTSLDPDLARNPVSETQTCGELKETLATHPTNLNPADRPKVASRNHHQLACETTPTLLVVFRVVCMTRMKAWAPSQRQSPDPHQQQHHANQAHPSFLPLTCIKSSLGHA